MIKQWEIVGLVCCGKSWASWTRCHTDKKRKNDINRCIFSSKQHSALIQRYFVWGLIHQEETGIFWVSSGLKPVCHLTVISYIILALALCSTSSLLIILWNHPPVLSVFSCFENREDEWHVKSLCKKVI